MLDSEKIRNEEDPFLREIYGMGYDKVVMSEIDGKAIFYKGNKIANEIPLFLMEMTMYGCTIVRAHTHFGTIHKWIKEGDGSADKFRNLISDSELSFNLH